MWFMINDNCVLYCILINICNKITPNLKLFKHIKIMINSIWLFVRHKLYKLKMIIVIYSTKNKYYRNDR